MVRWVSGKPIPETTQEAENIREAQRRAFEHKVPTREAMLRHGGVEFFKKAHRYFAQQASKAEQAGAYVEMIKWGAPEEARRLAAGKEPVGYERGKLLEQGFVPVYVKGRITGFEHAEAGVSIPIKEFRKPEGVTVTIPRREAETPREELFRLAGMGTAVTAAPTTWQRAEEWTRREVSYPTAEWIYEKTGITKEEAGALVGVTAPTWVTPGLTIFPTEKEITFETERTTGRIAGLKEKPLKTAAWTAAFFVLPYGLGKIGRLARIPKLTAAYPKLAGITSTAIKGGLLGTYVGVTGARILLEPTLEARARKLGEIETTEITPMLVGSYLGSKFWPKLEGYIRTLGVKEIDTAKLVPRDVLYGEKRFPEAAKYKHLRLFLEGKYRLPGGRLPAGYHAYSEPWADLTVTKGKLRGFPGAYISYGVSPHFLKLEKGYELYGGGLFTGYGKPGVMYIEPKGFVRGYTTKLGWAGVPGVKREVEAVIPPGTELIKTGAKYYFKWRGVRVPIDTFKAGDLGTTAKTSGTLGKLSLSYGGLPPSYVTTPASYAFASIASLSSIASKASKTSISKISKISKDMSSIVSKISKIPSYPPSYPPTYKPPRYPPSRPPRKYPPSYPPYYPPYKPPYYPPYYPPYKEPPLLPPPPPLFPFLPKRARRKKLARRRRLIEDIGISEGFVARIARLKPIKIKRKDVRKLAKISLRPLGIRRIPQIIDIDKPRRRKTKRKKRRR